MGPYVMSPIIVSLMDQPVQMAEVFTFPIKKICPAVPDICPATVREGCITAKIPPKIGPANFI